jgi:hypothetical protein
MYPLAARVGIPLGTDGDAQNVLFILTDQQPSDRLGYCGNDPVETLIVDRLPVDWTRFERGSPR